MNIVRRMVKHIPPADRLAQQHDARIAERARLIGSASESELRAGELNRLHCRYPQYRIGRWSYGDLTVRSWGEGAALTVGAFCSIAPGAQILLRGEHRSDWVTTFPFNSLWESAKHVSGHPMNKGDVVIGNDVWIGTEAMIMSGVTIGDGAVVGARSLVSRDVEPYSIVAGNPARLVRMRFSEATVKRLLDLRWWELRDEEIVHLLPWMLGPDIQAFIIEAERRRTGG
jgi:acetyltransferase-like isoleucine patch superfamily enzyme